MSKVFDHVGEVIAGVFAAALLAFGLSGFVGTIDLVHSYQHLQSDVSRLTAADRYNSCVIASLESAQGTTGLFAADVRDLLVARLHLGARAPECQQK